MKNPWLTLLLLSTVITLNAQDNPDLTRREKLQLAQSWLLEEHFFTPEELMDLENTRQQAILNEEPELASDLTLIIFAAKKTRETQIFSENSQTLLSQDWLRETKRRDLEMTRGLMNGAAGTLAVIASASLGAGAVFFQMSNLAFSDYARTTVNSPESTTYRQNFETYQAASYACMISSGILYFLSTRFMFLQN